MILNYSCCKVFLFKTLKNPLPRNRIVFIMVVEKIIAVLCDNGLAMANVINGLKSKTIFSNTIVSAVHVADLNTITKTVLPDLIILCFENNQDALKDLKTFFKKPEIPVLCLTKKNENRILYWDRNSIVFTFPEENIQKGEYFQTQIQSIFLLRNNGVNQQPKIPAVNQSLPVRHFENSNLSRYVMELDQKISALHKVKERITELFPKVDDPTRLELSSIVNSIKTSVNDTKLWEDFKLYFEKTHPDFLLTLSKKHPELTMKDLKYCCYLKMNMTNNDIRNLLGINQESVRTHKFRLKKKMALPRSLDLINYLRSVA